MKMPSSLRKREQLTMARPQGILKRPGSSRSGQRYLAIRGSVYGLFAKCERSPDTVCSGYLNHEDAVCSISTFDAPR